jgi:hypothetical protein
LSVLLDVHVVLCVVVNVSVVAVVAVTRLHRVWGPVAEEDAGCCFEELLRMDPL